jgi:pyridoxine 4-dehydrogenase
LDGGSTGSPPRLGRRLPRGGPPENVDGSFKVPGRDAPTRLVGSTTAEVIGYGGHLFGSRIEDAIVLKLASLSSQRELSLPQDPARRKARDRRRLNQRREVRTLAKQRLPISAGGRGTATWKQGLGLVRPFGEPLTKLPSVSGGGGIYVTPGVSASRAGTVQIGTRQVNRLGLGTNRLTDTEAARGLLRRAVELGVDFIDTADVYQARASETTLGAVFGAQTATTLVATKGGMVWTPDGKGRDGSPEYLRQAVEGSLLRLRAKRIELYQLHWVDPKVPIETSVAALKELQDAGQIHRIGLCNVTVDEIERARGVAEIVSVQDRYNLLERQNELVVDYCEAQSITFMPWTPLMRGKLTQSRTLVEMATEKGVSPNQLALSWLLKRSPVMLPIPGTLSPVHLEENLSAADIELSQADYRRLDESSPALGAT